VFVRRPGQTVRANSAELAALVARAQAGRRVSGLRVALAEPAAVAVVDFSAEAISRWVEHARDDCLRSLRQHQQRQSSTRVDVPEDAVKDFSTYRAPPRGLTLPQWEELRRRHDAGEQLSEDELAQLAEANHAVAATVKIVTDAAANWFGQLVRTEPEPRTPEEYVTQVEQYLQTCRAVLPGVLRARAGGQLPACRFALRNETESNVPGVEVVMHIAGDVQAVDDDEVEEDLPVPPRPYGPRQISKLNLGPTTFPPSYVLSGRGGSLVPRGPRVHVDNGDSVTLRFDPLDLRPHETVLLPPVVLLPQADGTNPIMANWRATSTGLDGRTQGETPIPLGPMTWTVADILDTNDVMSDDA
jgi:hypothetical protein